MAQFNIGERVKVHDKQTLESLGYLEDFGNIFKYAGVTGTIVEIHSLPEIDYYKLDTCEDIMFIDADLEKGENV